jgi:hypothetical protein
MGAIDEMLPQAMIDALQVNIFYFLTILSG